MIGCRYLAGCMHLHLRLSIALWLPSVWEEERTWRGKKQCSCTSINHKSWLLSLTQCISSIYSNLARAQVSGWNLYAKSPFRYLPDSRSVMLASHFSDFGQQELMILLLWVSRLLGEFLISCCFLFGQEVDDNSESTNQGNRLFVKHNLSVWQKILFTHQTLAHGISASRWRPQDNWSKDYTNGNRCLWKS